MTRYDIKKNCYSNSFNKHILFHFTDSWHYSKLEFVGILNQSESSGLAILLNGTFMNFKNNKDIYDGVEQTNLTKYQRKRNKSTKFHYRIKI